MIAKVLLVLLPCALAFAPAARHATKIRPSRALYMGEMSKSLPFLKRPEMLNGTIIGDVGFDPMGLSSQLELNYIRASEIKHGRVAMLATVGYLVQQYVQLPLYHEANPIKAWSSVPVAANVQIILFCGIFELATLTSTVRGGEPGAYGYDPLGFSKGKTKEQMDDLKLKELKNGRLAMFAIFGMVAQSFLFDKPTLSF